MEHRPRRLPWETPVASSRRPLPWLRSALFGLALLAAGGTAWGLRGCTGSPHEPPEPLPESACHDPVELPGRLPAEFLVDPALQAFATDLLSRHPAVLTVAVGLDLRSSRVLFLATRQGSSAVGHDIALATASRYPFASLAKILTSAAAMSTTGLQPDSPTWLRGHPHTLYKSQLRSDTDGVELPLAKAFALSINPVFGNLGLHRLGSSVLLQWADSLGFNRMRGLGNGVPSGRMAAPVDSYNLAEISSGFVRTTFGSPVQAAMIARKFAGDGMLRPPSWSGFQPDSACPPDTSAPDRLRRQMIELFEATVDSGTARGGFESAWPRAARAGFQTGGKTGSLDGTDPPGRYEWFAGFARLNDRPDTGIAIAVMTVNDNHGALNASWTAAALMAAWSRRYDLLSDPTPVTASLGAGLPLLLDDDRDALAEKPWHRPWRPKRRVRRR